MGEAEKATGAFSEKAIQGVSTMPIPFASVKKMKLKEQLPWVTSMRPVIASHQRTVIQDFKVNCWTSYFAFPVGVKTR